MLILPINLGTVVENIFSILLDKGIGILAINGIRDIFIYTLFWSLEITPNVMWVYDDTNPYKFNIYL